MYSRIEKETIISFNEQDSECELYTCNHEIISTLTKRCRSYPKVYKLYAEGCGGYTFHFPKDMMKVYFKELDSNKGSRHRKLLHRNKIRQ